MERFTDVTKLTVPFRNVANAPEKLDVSRIRSGNTKSPTEYLYKHVV